MSATTADARGRVLTDAARAARRIQLRRALTLLAMTLVAPGSAQLAAGNRRVGLIALRCYAVVLVGGLGLLALVLFWRSEVISLFTSLTFLWLLRFGLIALSLGWAYLIIDAWRIAVIKVAQRAGIAVL